MLYPKLYFKAALNTYYINIISEIFNKKIKKVLPAAVTEFKRFINLI